MNIKGPHQKILLWIVWVVLFVAVIGAMLWWVLRQHPSINIPSNPQKETMKMPKTPTLKLGIITVINRSEGKITLRVVHAKTIKENNSYPEYITALVIKDTKFFRPAKNKGPHNTYIYTLVPSSFSELVVGATITAGLTQTINSKEPEFSFITLSK